MAGEAEGPTVRVSSWAELQDEIFRDSWRQDLRRFRSPYVFRGAADPPVGLQTSLMSLGGRYEEMEEHLYRNFRKYAHRTEVERDSVWHWLALGQHHGLPTRLLDWTFSPYVALHFATTEPADPHEDAAVWAVDFEKVHRMAPEAFQEEMRRGRSDLFTVEMLERVAPTLADFDKLAAEPFVVFFDPPSMDERMVNQYALFSALSDATMSYDTWLAAHPDVYRKIVVPADLKWEVRDKLDQANISERVLFPGLDGLSRWLKRNYSTRP